MARVIDSDPFGIQLLKCLKPDCLRKVRSGVLYCCGNCASADDCGFELAGPDAHSLLRHADTCDQRSAERGGEWTWSEGQAHLQQDSGRKDSSP